ncbi:MAG: polysaccharide biosynthesis protein [Caldisericia bacterium]
MKRVALIGDLKWCETLKSDINSSGTLIVTCIGSKIADIDKGKTDIVFVSPTLNGYKELVESIIGDGIPVQIIPNGNAPTHHISDDKLIERLIATGLIREQTECTDEEGKFINGKRVMITGAGGSIGSDLARKLLKFKPSHIALVDNTENGVYEIDLDMSIDGFTDKTPIVSDIRNRSRVRSIMEFVKPDIVFHIAARKHVPLMEMYPEEAVTTNINGTMIVLEEADRIGAERFTFISTDKAADPANIMGATKRIAERVIQRYNKPSLKRCIVRFENVLDSRGNVVYTFLRQLRRGSQLTVTSPKMDRYFITRDHASLFIIRASNLAENGEVFVPDAGPPINISTLASTIGKVMGYTEGKDFEIVYTKPRPGEKMSEELVTKAEMARQKKLNGIFIIPAVDDHPDDFDMNLKRLIDAAERVDRKEIRELIAELEPTYNP